MRVAVLVGRIAPARRVVAHGDGAVEVEHAVDVTSGEARPWARVLLLVPLSAGIGAAMAAARRWQLDRALAQGLA